MEQYKPRDEYEKGAVELFVAFNRYLNEHDVARFPVDTQLSVLLPFLVAHRGMEKARAKGE